MSCYFSSEASLGTAPAPAAAAAFFANNNAPSSLKNHFIPAALENSRRVLLADDSIFFVTEADPTRDDEDQHHGVGGEEFAVAVTCITVSTATPLAIPSLTSMVDTNASSISSNSLSSSAHNHHHQQQQQQVPAASQQGSDTPSQDMTTTAASVSWKTRLLGVRINHVVGLTMLELLDGPALVVVLRHGFMLLNPKRGKPILLGESKSASVHHHHSNHTSNNVGSVIMPFGFSSSSGLVVVDIASGGILVAGVVNPITLMVMSDLRCGFILQQDANNNSSSSSSSVGQSASFLSTVWIELPVDIGLPRCVSRNFNSAVAISFAGAPHVYLWLEPELQSQKPQQHTGPAAAAPAAVANSASLSSSSSPRSLTGTGVRSFQLSAAFQTTASPSSRDAQQQLLQQQCPLFREEDLVHIQSSFLAVTTMTWISDCVIVAGSSCGHVSYVDLSSGTTQTALEQVSAVRLPSRSAVPASVTFVVEVDHRGQRDHKQHASNSLTLLCMTSRCDIFVISFPSRTVTHALFCGSELLRQPLLLDGLIHQAAGTILHGRKHSSSSHSSSSSRHLQFICQESSIENSNIQHIVRVVVSLDAAGLSHFMSLTDSVTAPIVVPFERYSKHHGPHRPHDSDGGGGSWYKNKNGEPIVGDDVLVSASAASLVGGGGSEAIQNGAFAVAAPSASRKTVKKWLRQHLVDNQQEHHQHLQEFAGYHLRQMVGKGEFGEVWMVTSVATKKIFALKRLVGGLNDSAAILGGVGGSGGRSSPLLNNNNAASVGASHALHNEESVLQLPPHPNILQCIESVQQVVDAADAATSASASAATPIRKHSSSSSASSSTHNSPPPRGGGGGGGASNSVAASQKGLVLSFAFGGTLETRLHAHCEQEEKSCGGPPGGASKQIHDLEVVSWLVQLLAGLAHLHHHGVLHRDVKAANVLDRGGGRFCWADFGVSRNVGSGRTKVGTAVGTPAYHAPEMLATIMLPSPAPASKASDVWSLAAMFYCILCRRPRGTAPTPYDIRPVLDGLLPTLESVARGGQHPQHPVPVPPPTASEEDQQQQQRSSSSSNNNNNNSNNDSLPHKLSPSGIPLRILKVIDCMMRLDRKERPTAEQCLAALRLLDAQEDANFFHLGEGNSHLLRQSIGGGADGYLLYHCEPRQPPTTIMFVTVDQAIRSRIFLGLRFEQQRLEFWPLAGLLPDRRPAYSHQHSSSSSSSSSNSTLPPTAPRVFVSNMTVTLPNRALADAVRVGVVATSLAPDSGSVSAGTAALAELKSKTLHHHPSKDKNILNKNLVAGEHRKQQAINNNNGSSSTTTTTIITLPPPAYIFNVVALLPLLSMSVNAVSRRVPVTTTTTAGAPQQQQEQQTAHAETLFFSIEFSLPSPAILSLPQWIDNARDPTEAAKRINKACRAVLKFLAYCNSEPALRLPVTSFCFEQCFVDPTTETVLLPRTVNPLTVALVVDAADRSLDSCASSGVLSNMLLRGSNELREYSHLMTRSALDSVLVVVDSFSRAFDSLREATSTDSAPTRHQKQSSSAVVVALAKATEFVSLHTQFLQVRKAVLLGQTDAPHKTVRGLLEKDEADPDDTLAPEFSFFFSL